MHKLLFLSVFIFSISINCFSQVDSYIENLPNVCEMFEYKDQLFFTTVERKDNSTVLGTLAKVDLFEEDPVIDSFLEIPEIFTGIYIEKDNLYYTVFEGNAVYKLNLNDLNAEPEIFVDGLYFTRDIEIFDSKMYVIASQDEFESENVFMFDLYAIESRPIRLFKGYVPLRILSTEDHVYISSKWDDSIFRTAHSDINMETELFLDSLFGPTALLELENTLYFADNIGEGDFDGRLLKVDLSDSEKEVVHFTAGFEGHHELVYHNNYIYISEVLGNRISRIELPINTTSVSTKANLSINVYPNPTDNYLFYEGDFGREYFIYNASGELVSSGSIDKFKSISIKQLSAGNYFIVFDEGFHAVFQKVN